MAKAEILKPFILSWEGGFSITPGDRGGATNKGITIETYRSVFGKERTVEDLKTITDIEWMHIYKSLFWDKWKADEIKSHPFFKGVDWDNIRNTMKPPFVPDIENDYDTKYFETFEEEKDEPFYPPKKGLKKRKDVEWLGFTYKGGNDEEIDKFQQNVEKKVEDLHINEENDKNIDTDNGGNNIKNK